MIKIRCSQRNNKKEIKGDGESVIALQSMHERRKDENKYNIFSL